jgi:dolichol-phosphate mannosyltransferase
LTKIFENFKPKTIFNLAAYGAYSKQSDFKLIYETNIIGLLNILEISNNVKVLINAGSSSEYGLNCDRPLESEELKPNSHYSISKITASYLIYYYSNFYNLLCLNLRLYSVYGPLEEPDRLMPKIIENGLDGFFPLLTSPKTTRDFIYIEDCLEAFIEASININKSNSGQSINIGSGHSTDLQSLSHKVKNIFKIKESPNWGSMKSRDWDTPNWSSNSNKAKILLGWEAKTTIDQGIMKFSKWQKSVDYKEKVIKPFLNKSSKKIKISAVIACYKDELAIPIMYERLVKVFNKMNVFYEIIFVNDNSPDNSQIKLEQICSNDINVIVIKHSRNFGSQSAFISGLEISSGDAAVLMDGDLQDPPELIEEFYFKWTKGYDVVYGIRSKSETSILMNLAYKTFYRILNKLSNIHIPLHAGDFSMLDRKVINLLVSFNEKDQFIRGLRAWVGFKQTGVEYVRPDRMFGKSTNNLRKNIGWAKKGIFSFSYMPLELISYFGFLITLISFVGVVYQIISKIINPNLPHGISTIIILIAFFGGIQLFSISIIGEYLSKVLDEVKSRPKFIRDGIWKKGKKNSNINDIN